jgi:N-acetylglucosaminyldiphosphoundecaprenol N-acetyl-beta-D-mannosaminyltransferase
MKSPRFSSPPTPEEIDNVRGDLEICAPDILLVGLGSPKQEQVIRALRKHLPATWMIGVGISMSFVAGDVRRAPLWVQSIGFEWAWRMAQEPRRLARRYLIDDLPFAVELFGSVLAKRFRR